VPTFLRVGGCLHGGGGAVHASAVVVGLPCSVNQSLAACSRARETPSSSVVHSHPLSPHLYVPQASIPNVTLFDGTAVPDTLADPSCALPDEVSRGLYYPQLLHILQLFPQARCHATACVAPWVVALAILARLRGGAVRSGPWGWGVGFAVRRALCDCLRCAWGGARCRRSLREPTLGPAWD